MMRYGLVFILNLLFVLTQVYAVTNLAVPADHFTDELKGIIVTKDNPEFVIKLKSNPSTGFNWYLRSYDNHLVSIIKHEKKPAEDVEVVGAPMLDMWYFKINPVGFIVPQQTTVQLIYARPWDTQQKVRRVVFRIFTP